MFFFFFCPDGITPNSGLTGPRILYNFILMVRKDETQVDFFRLIRYIYNGLKSPYDDIMSAVDDFLSNGTQAVQRRLEKCVDRKEDYVKK